jgi:hypothetical protein
MWVTNTPSGSRVEKLGGGFREDRGDPLPPGGGKGETTEANNFDGEEFQRKTLSAEIP